MHNMDDWGQNILFLKKTIKTYKNASKKFLKRFRTLRLVNLKKVTVD
jgi:hypothetical protein